MKSRKAPLRVAVTAVALCAVSFFAGIAGDLAAAPPSRSGVSVVLTLPPDLPRAGPLPPLAVEAVEVAYVAPRRPSLRAEAVLPREKPQIVLASYEPKENPDLAPKDGDAPALVAEYKA